MTSSEAMDDLLAFVRAWYIHRESCAECIKQPGLTHGSPTTECPSQAPIAAKIHDWALICAWLLCAESAPRGAKPWFPKALAVAIEAAMDRLSVEILCPKGHPITVPSHCGVQKLVCPACSESFSWGAAHPAYTTEALLSDMDHMDEARQYVVQLCESYGKSISGQ